MSGIGGSTIPFGKGGHTHTWKIRASGRLALIRDSVQCVEAVERRTLLYVSSSIKFYRQYELSNLSVDGQ